MLSEKGGWTTDMMQSGISSVPSLGCGPANCVLATPESMKEGKESSEHLRSQRQTQDCEMEAWTLSLS